MSDETRCGFWGGGAVRNLGLFTPSRGKNEGQQPCSCCSPRCRCSTWRERYAPARGSRVRRPPSPAVLPALRTLLAAWLLWPASVASPAMGGVSRSRTELLNFHDLKLCAPTLYPSRCMMCEFRKSVSIFVTNGLDSPAWPGVGSRLSVRPRCRALTDHRVGASRLSGVRVVRHDGSTPQTTPTVCPALPAPHALTPACSIHCR